MSSPMQDEEQYDTTQHNEDFQASNKRKRAESPASEEKRRKLDPSKVLFLRQLPHHVTDQQILAAIPEDTYGRPRIVLVRNNHTAFIEFENIELAKQFLETCNGEVYIGDRTAIVTWSERQELDQKGSDNEHPCKVLHLTVVNARLPLYVHQLEKFFYEYGLEKMTCFTTKSGQQQALIQFKSVEDASTAKQAIEGVEMFNNCRAHLSYSKTDDLIVKYNNERSKDYTRDLPASGMRNYDNRGGYQQPPPPPATGGFEHNSYYNQGYPDQSYPDYGAVGGEAPYNNYGGYGHGAPMQAPYGAPPAAYGGYMHNDRYNQGGKVLLVNNLSPKTTCDELFILFGVWGDVDAVKIHNKKPDTAFVEFTTAQGAETALQNTKGFQLPLHGQDLVVQRSKHPYIKPPKNVENDHNQQTFKSYKNHAHHRFRGNRRAKTYKNISPPTTSLHFANLHGDVTEDELKAYVDPYGTVESIHLFGKKDCLTKDQQPTTKQMAIVEFGSLSGAVRVLVNRHVGDELRGFKPRISFSRKTNQQRNHE